MLSRAFLLPASDVYKPVSVYGSIEAFRPVGVKHGHLSFGEDTDVISTDLISILTSTSDYCCCGAFGPFVCMW